MSDEVKHPNASYLPAMVATVLKKRIPHHEDLVLTRWYGGNKGIDRWRVLKYRIVQAVSSILLFDALDVIGRAGEAARLSGVEFSQSFPGIRGSQYKVEGVVLRSLQSLVLDGQGEERNYFFFSPSKNDCGNQEALECQAMTLEPQSGFHFDPIVVCDFTALYPSLVIAYNLCYSTIAGKLEYHSTRSEMLRKGTTTQKLGPYDYDEARTAFVLKHHMKSLSSKDGQQNNVPDRAYCMPTGSIFVSEDVMKGVLPNLLDEMLSTRAMLKKAAKIYRKHLPDPPAAVLRQLEARQLALKYVANVTCKFWPTNFFLLRLIGTSSSHL
jgi:DNA polymerase zeta